MCDCFHLAFPNWHAASSGTGAGRRLRGPEPGTEDHSVCDEPSQFTEGERPRPQGSSPVEEFPETEKYTDSDKECEADNDPHQKRGKKNKKSGFGSVFDKRSTPKMSKLKEVHSPDSGVIVKTAKDGCAEGLIYGGGGKEGIFIKEVVPESPASKSLKLKEGDQVLSATVYFDNVSYEDAIQILEHAQAYKVKLCLKRKADATDNETAVDSDVIPEEEELDTAEMREQGKTKRRGDARISWPKFPSFGKGRKSRFTRSHSSSEADEQRKLELSPTTSDTESPIKSQDALKGKKKHKIKLSVLTKRSRISSSEEQDTETPVQTQESSDMLSPECLEGPIEETREVYMTDDLAVVEDLDTRPTEPAQHKAELISIDSTLKTEDLTVALAGQESPVKSPDGKKKKKERSELKMKILGKDKSHKKEAKAKASPKRLKTLGASVEMADQAKPDEGDQLALDTQIITPEKVELDVPIVASTQKSPQKGKDKKKGKESKQKQDKSSPFKLPKVTLGDIGTDETITKVSVSVKESTTTIKDADVKEDPYEKLSKITISRTDLPKREDIEIPGMEDASVTTKTTGVKEPKGILTEANEESQSETVQLSIDVNSVKEAVSKLPGYKLPKVDTSGVPIPEEITLIDANAQRISVKTPTKVVDTKQKHEAHFSSFNVTASQEISKTSFKLPKIPTADLSAEEFIVAKVELKPEDEYKVEQKEIIIDSNKREDIIIPGKEKTEDVPKLQDSEDLKSETEFTAATHGKESEKKSKKSKMLCFGKPDISDSENGTDLPRGDKIKGERTKKDKRRTGAVMVDLKLPEFDTPTVTSAEPPRDDIEYIDSVESPPVKSHGDIKLMGFDVTLDAQKPKMDISFPEITGDVRDLNVTRPEATAELKLPEAPHTDVTLGGIDVSMPEQKWEAEKPDFGDKHLQAGEVDGHGGKFKIPRFGIKIPKIKGPELDLSQSKKDVDVKLPVPEAEVKSNDGPAMDITVGTAEVSLPEPSVEVNKPQLDIKPLQTESEPDQKSKFKMPKLGITMPKVKGPEIDFSLSKQDVDGALPQPQTEIKLPEKPSATMEIKSPEKKISKSNESSPSKFKLPTFKLPKFGVGASNISVEVPDADKDVKIKSADINIPDEVLTVDITTPSMGIEGPSIDMKTSVIDQEGKGSKFKMPSLGFSMPKVKGPKIDLSLSSKDGEMTLPEAKADLKIPEAQVTLEEKLDTPEAQVDVKLPETPKINVDINPPEFETETEEHGGKFKIPRFGIKIPKIKGPEIDLSLSKKSDVQLPEGSEIDVNIGKADVSIPEVKRETETPDLSMQSLETEGELGGQGDKFKMPKFGIKMPKLKGPEIDLSLPKRDGHVKLQDTKADIKLPEGPEIDVNLGKAGVAIPEVKMEIEKTELQAQNLQIEGELGGQGDKFKIPKFGIKMPKLKGPEIDLSLSKSDRHVKLPDAKADIKLPEGPEIDVNLGKAEVSVQDVKMEIEKPKLQMQNLQTEGELGGQGDKFKIPKFGIKMPKIKGPEIDFGLSKKDGHVKLPDTKADVKLSAGPEIDMNIGSADVSVPEVTVNTEKPDMPIQSLETEGELGGQGDKFKMPKFGLKMPKLKGPEIDLSLPKRDGHVKLSDTKADIKLPEGPEIDVNLGKAEFSVPDVKMEIEKPELQTQNLQIEGELGEQGDKFKIPKFGIKMPKIKGPEIDFGLSKKDGHVKLPDTKADVKLPEGSEIDINLGKTEVSLPEVKMEIEKPELETQNLQIEGELGGQGDKFKMPKFGIKMPKIKGPEMDLSLSKRDGHVKLPDTKIDVKLPEGPEIDVNIGKPEVSVPDVKMEIKLPGLQVQTESELGGHDEKFKIPKFGIKMPKLKGPEFDFSLSKKDRDITMPDTKADITLPEAPDVSIPEVKMEMEKPELQMQTEGELGGHRDKFRMPKFGIKAPKFKGPEIDISLSKKDADVAMPRPKVEVPDAPKTSISLGEAGIALVKMEAEEPELEIKPLQSQIESEGHGGKFKMPKFGVSMPKVKGPEFHLGFSKKDVDVPLPETKADVTIPAVGLSEPSAKVEIKAPEIEATTKSRDGSPLKFKTPHLPSFSFSMPKVKGPEIDLSLSKKDKDMALPDAKVEAKLPEAPKIDISIEKAGITIPEMEVEKPDLDGKPLQADVELEEKRSKFKMPKFGITLPKVTGPEIDLSIAKKDGEVTVPEAEVNLPEKDLKDPSVGVEIKAPGIKVVTKEKEGSPSKFKMPTFKLPKFGVSAPSITTEGPDIDKDVRIDGSDIKVAEEVLSVSITAPSIDADRPSIHMTTTETEHAGKGIKFKMPHLGFSVPQVKGPDITLSKTDEDKTPKATAEVQLPDYDHSVGAEIKAPGTDVQTGNVEGSPSKFKMPAFKLPKLGGTTLQVSAEVPDMDKDIKVDGAEIKLPEAKVDDAKFKKPRFSLPRFSFSKPSTKEPEIDVNLPAVDVATTEGNLEVKQPDVDIKAKGDVELDGQESKFKMPKFGISMPKVKGPDINLSLSKKDVDVTIPEAEVQLPDVEIKQPTAEVEIKAPKINVEIPDVDKDLQIDGEKMDLPTVDIEARSIDIEGKSLDVKDKIRGSEGSGGIFKRPDFSISVPKVKGPEIDFSFKKRDASFPNASVELPDTNKDIQVEGPEVKIPKGGVSVDFETPSIEIEGPSMDVTMTGTDADGKERKFKVPKFGISLPKVQGPDVDLSMSKSDVDVKLPEAKAEIKLPEIPQIDADLGKIDISVPDAELKVQKPEILLEGEVDEKTGKFKLPKFGVSVPKIKGPEIDLSLSKKNVDVTLPEVKAEVSLPDAELKELSAKVEIKAPESDMQVTPVKESALKFKLPKFNFPKLGTPTPNVSVEAHEMDKEIKIDGTDGQISVPKTEVGASLVKAEVQLPEVEIKEPSATVVTEQPSIDVDAKLKKPRFSLPRFSFSKPSVKAPEVDASVQDVNVAIPGEGLDVKGGELEGEAEIESQGSKFKMPKFGISMPKVKGPEIDLSLTKKDVDVSLPEASVEVQLPSVEVAASTATVEIKAPEMEAQLGNVEGSLTESKLPTFNLPTFGAATPSISVEVPDMDKEIKIDGTDGQISVPKTDLGTLQMKAEVQLPEVEIKEPSAAVVTEQPSIDIDAKLKKPRFSLPRFSFSKPSVKAPEADASVQDVNVAIPGEGLDVKGGELEGEAEIESQGSKFKMPKFGISMPKVKGPEIDLSLTKKDVDVSLPEASVEVQLPSVEVAASSATVEIKAPEMEAELSNVEGSLTESKLPTFGAATSSISAEIPDIDKNIKIDGADIHISAPEKEAVVKLPEVDVKESLAGVVTEQPSIELEAKLKKPRFSLPRFSFSKPSVKAPEVDASPQDVNAAAPEGGVDVKGAQVDVKPPEQEGEIQGSKFKMPTFGITMPKVTGPEIDLNLSKKDRDVTLPEPKAEGPDDELTQPSIGMEIKPPESTTSTKDTDSSPSKFKMPTFKLRKSSVTVEVPDVEKDVKIHGAEIKVPEEVLSVDITAPKIDTDLPSLDITTKDGVEKDITIDGADIKLAEAKVDEAKLKKPRFSLPRFSFSKASTKEPEAEASVPDIDVSIPAGNVELEQTESDLKLKEAEGELDGQKMMLTEEAGTVDADAPDTEAVKSGSKFKLPGFGVSVTKVKGPEIDVSVSKTDVISLPEAKAEVELPEAEVKEDENEVPESDVPVVVAKRPSWTFPKFSFSRKTSEADVSPEVPKVEVTLPEDKTEVSLDVEVKEPSVAISTEPITPPITEPDVTVKKKFSLPRFSFSKASVKGPEEPDVEATTPEVKPEDRVPEVEAKASLTIEASETEASSVDIKMEESKAEILDSEAAKTEPDAGQGSPSKFKLPLFKFFSKPKTEEEQVTPEPEAKDEQQEQEMEEEPKVDSKSPKMSLTSFGDILKNIDVEFDVPKTDKEEEQLETSNEAQEKLSEAKEQETAKQEATKSPERTGWFKFPRFGLSSPSEPPKKKDEPKDEKSPEGEMSPTSSVQSSDAFADISSAMTSEHVGLSLSSPTKVTVKYSDPNAFTGLEDIHSNVIISTTRSELFSVEPNLPEKVTILSSGPSSSSEDTLRLESGKIHVITSNIQATPESQLAKLLTAVQVQPGGDLSLTSEGNEAASWTVETSQSSKRTVFEKHTVVRQISGESKETVITKQITHVFDSTEPISDETATSIQRLRDSVHSEKMRFFDGTEE